MNLTFSALQPGALLPAGVTGAAARAAREELALLAVLAADPALGIGYEEKAEAIAAAAGIKAARVEACVQFWRGAGVLSLTEDGSDCPLPPAVSAPEEERARETRPRALLSSDTQQYSGVELEALLTANGGGLRHLVEECQNMAGKIFTPTEVGKIVFLADGLGLSNEHILLLYTYCIGKEKNSVRYLEKTAVNLFNEGVDSAEAFEAYLRRKEEAASYENAIRTLFGIGERALSTNEKKYLTAWQEDWKVSPDLVGHAFQICVDTKGSLSFPYINKILQNWHEEGIRTPEQAEASRAAYRERKQPAGKPSGGNTGSFETDAFIAAAIRRSRRTAKDRKEG